MVTKVAQTVVIAGRTVQLLEVMLPTEITSLVVCKVLIEQQQSSNVPKGSLQNLDSELDWTMDSQLL